MDSDTENDQNESTTSSSDDELINTTNYDLKDLTKKSKHKIWEHFGVLYKLNVIVSKTKDRIFCRRCFEKKIFKSYASATSATVLMQHVAHEHRIQVSSERIEEKQRKLTEIFAEKKKDDNTSKGNLNEKFVFGRRLLVWLCRDLLPFNLVEKEGFLDFFNSMNRKKAEIPSRTSISNMALDDMYTCLKAKLIGHLKETQDHCCICFDMSSDRYRHISYITYTCHYITTKWKLESRVLKTSMFDGAHTAVRITDNFKNMTTEYGLQDKEIIAVVDGGSDVNCSVNSMGMEKFNCIAHSVNRLIQFDLIEKGNGIDAIKQLIAKVRKVQKSLLYAHSELSELAKGERQKQIFDFLEEITSIEEAIDSDERFDVNDELNRRSQGMNGLKCIANIRWNCIYKLCQAHFQHAAIIKKCLENRGNYELILNRSEIALLGRVVEMLEVFNTFTKYIQANSYPTLNSLILFYVEIQQGLQDIHRDSMCDVIKKAVDILLANLGHRFPLKDECMAAAILDPSSQHLPIINTWLRENDFTKEELLQRIVTSYKIKLPSDGSTTNQQDLNEDNRPQTSTRRVTLREKLLSQHIRIQRADNSIESELMRFEEIREIYDDALEFWAKFSDQYPNLSAIARVLFCIQATTATAESAFSFAGSVVRSRRAMLDPFRVEKVLFIHDNYDMFNF